ncbi:hypothetical protein TrST_g12737 [Triparma strigata]|uniref:Uncharacterized protein n=1 Tax=Triparma strigata TaxID=1606541 RepID=A0A9W7B1A4_9STRA|nr:hypothetical protein TrST_g12737 [Triparma strigata]
MSVTKEIRALFSEEDKIVGRPATPDLDDLSIPCVGSVKHLIDECREFEAPKFQTNQHLMEVLVENPTDGLELVNRSLEMLSHQDGVPEYDEIMSRDNMKALELLEGGGGRDSEDEASWVDGDATMYDQRSFDGGSTLNTYSVGGSALDGLSLASNSLQGSTWSLKDKGIEVTWKGKKFRNSSSFSSSLLDNVGDEDGSSVGGMTMGMDLSLGGDTSYSVGGGSVGGGGVSVVSKKKRVKPRDFPKKLRKRGPFSMVGPRDVKVSLGLPPIQSTEQRKEIVQRYRTRKYSHDKLIEGANTSSDQLERAEKAASHQMGREIIHHHEASYFGGNLLERSGANGENNRNRSGIIFEGGRHRGGRQVSKRVVSKTPKEIEKEKINAMKGLEKLKYLMKDLDVEEGDGTSYKELIPKVLGFSPKRRGGSRGMRRSHGEVGVNRNVKFTTLKPMKEVTSQWDRMAEEEVTEDERWLEEAIQALRRQMSQKQSRQEEQKEVEEHIRRVSKKAKRGILNRHRKTVMTSPDRSFERTHVVDETLPHEVYQRKQDEMDEHREYQRIRRETQGIKK